MCESLRSSRLTDRVKKSSCLLPQMEVGLAAADAIKKVHGMSYTVGTSPNVLCKCLTVPSARPRWT